MASHYFKQVLLCLQGMINVCGLVCINNVFDGPHIMALLQVWKLDSC
jgi:hypothetical protein